ncbi:hypothetical protein MAR_027416 [Mya arenaria]|uniref:Uncharacterized protein n=1 Tax=Mya arenaria TaxID=6604 RepID=A0ABY7EX01_MYAAR|nr:hypothetical protein MAR_027416 [Mya arenaria]
MFLFTVSTLPLRQASTLGHKNAAKKVYRLFVQRAHGKCPVTFHQRFASNAPNLKSHPSPDSSVAKLAAEEIPVSSDIGKKHIVPMYARDQAGQITDAEMKPSQDVMIPTVFHIAMSISRHVTDTRRAIATMHVIQAAATRDIMTVRTEEITPTLADSDNDDQGSTRSTSSASSSHDVSIDWSHDQSPDGHLGDTDETSYTRDMDFRAVEEYRALVTLYRELPRDMCVQQILREYSASESDLERLRRQYFDHLKRTALDFPYGQDAELKRRMVTRNGEPVSARLAQDVYHIIDVTEGRDPSVLKDMISRAKTRKASVARKLYTGLTNQPEEKCNCEKENHGNFDDGVPELPTEATEDVTTDVDMEPMSLWQHNDDVMEKESGNPIPVITCVKDIEWDGFQIVRKKHHTERFCVFGLNSNVNTELLATVVSKKGLDVKSIQVFPLRKNPSKVFLKLCLSADDNSKRVLSDGFWPSYVTCKPWRARVPSFGKRLPSSGHGNFTSGIRQGDVQAQWLGQDVPPRFRAGGAAKTADRDDGWSGGRKERSRDNRFNVLRSYAVD